MDYFKNDLASIHDDLVNKKYSVEELTKSTFDNIKKVDKEIEAFLKLDEERALEKARKIDERGVKAGAQEAGQCHCGTGKVCRYLQESADARIYAFPAGTADNSRKACNTLDTGVSDGSGGSGVCTEYVKTARIERNDRYTGKFSGTF